MKRIASAFVLCSTLTAFACDRPAQGRPAPGGVASEAGTALTVDSILPSGEALRRFQAELSPVSELRAGAGNRDDLVARFVRAVERGDTATLLRLLVSKAEYAFLYFPSSGYSKKPYELPPEIAWLLSQQNSQKGFTRVTRRLGGKRLEFGGYECGDSATEGENRFWRSCQIRYIDPASHRPVTRRLFGAIMERKGGYKFLSYANDF